MKKHLTILSQSVILIFCLYLYSCNSYHEETPSPSIPKVATTVYNEADRLVFKNRTAFENYSTQLGKNAPVGTSLNEHLSKIERGLNFISLREHKYSQKKSTKERTLSNCIDDDYLASMLNPDGIVQVGEWIFKIDLCNEKVFALNEKHANLLEELKKGNVTDKNIKVFSTNEEVFELLEQENSTSSKRTEILCTKESGADRRDDKHNEDIFVSHAGAVDLVMRSDMKHVYQKAGIYFSLMLELKYQFNTIPSATTFAAWVQLETDISATITYRFKQKCKNNDTDWQTEYISVQDDNKLNKRLWESSNALNRYYLDTEFTWVSKVYKPDLPNYPKKDQPIRDFKWYLMKSDTKSYHMEVIQDNI